MISFESPEQFKKFVIESSLEEFKKILTNLSPSEYAESFVLLQTQAAIESKRKLNHLFQAVDTPTNLELLGKNFSGAHFLSFLEFLNHHPSYQNRLTFILVGLHPLVFSQALHFISDNHLAHLKNEGLLEPLQYHLTQFAHEGEALHRQTELKIHQFMQNLSSIEHQELTQEGLDDLFNQIDILRNQLLNYLERISTALSIVWHTDRIDLIEKLSSLNELLQHQLMQSIGHQTFDNLSATGLYFLLEQSLSSIFDADLKDEDAALEGMTRLSIWHLKDYWELGLLPSVHQVQELDLNSKQYTEEERIARQQRFFSLVQQQLERLQIGTVGSLKKAHLFSKSLLKTYINQHHHLLLET